MVHTKDGNIYYGELVEKVGDHVTILLATGVPKRIELKDIDPSPIARPLPAPPPDETRAPTETVRTKNGSVYHGELIEKIPADHVTLKLETGEIKTIDWGDIDASPPDKPRPPRRELAPTVNVRTKNGSIYHGEIVEEVVRDHVTIKLETGDIKTIDWEDITFEQPTPRTRPAPKLNEVELHFEADDANAVLQKENGFGKYEDVCASSCRELAAPSGLYRVAGRGLIPSPTFQLNGRRDNAIFAAMGSRDRHTAGLLLVGLAVPALIASVVLLVTAANAPSYAYVYEYPYSGYALPADNTALGVVTVTVNLAGLGLLVAGIALVATSSSTVKMNGEPLARLGIDGLHF